MIAVYPAFLQDRLTGGTALSSLTLFACMLVDGYVYSEEHETIEDVDEDLRPYDAVALTSVTGTGGHLDFADPSFVVPAATTPVPIVGLLVYSNETLIYYATQEHGLPWTPPAAGATRAWRIAPSGLFRL